MPKNSADMRFHRKSKLGWLVLAVVAVVGGQGCASTGAEDRPMIPEWDSDMRAQLALTVEPRAGCRDAATSLREAVEADMNDRLNAALRSHLAADSNRCDLVPSTDEGATLVGLPPSAIRPVDADQADYVKSDGQYLYKVEPSSVSRAGVLRIFAAQPADQSRQISQVELPGNPNRLVVYGDRALIYSVSPRLDVTAAAAGCRGCDANTPVTALLLYNVSDRNAPTLLSRWEMKGVLVSAQSSDSIVHSVIATSSMQVPLSYRPRELDFCKRIAGSRDVPTVLQAFDALRTENLARIRATDFEAAVPWLDGDGDASTGPACQLYRVNDGGTGFTTLVSFDLSADQTAPSVASIQSQQGAALVSAQTLYLAIDQLETTHAHNTAVHAFGLSQRPFDTAYLASGLVKGRLIDSSSMNEWRDHLRIVTTTGFAFNYPDGHNTLSVMGQRDGRLVVTGEIDGIAPGKDLRWVRFEAEHAFIATFSSLDPLWAFDLSDPDHPSTLAELMNPAYAMYLRMLDDRHVLSISYDRGGSGDSFGGMVLQIFDMLDPKSPPLRHELELGLPGSVTGAKAHNQTLQFSENKLALPVSNCELHLSGTGTRSPFELKFSGVIVYAVSPDTGFRELGRVANPSASAKADELVCSNWNGLTQPEVGRSIFLGDYLYTLTSNTMHVQDVRALGTDVATVQTP